MPTFYCANDKGILTAVQEPICNRRDVVALWGNKDFRDICLNDWPGADKSVEL